MVSSVFQNKKRKPATEQEQKQKQNANSSLTQKPVSPLWLKQMSTEHAKNVLHKMAVRAALLNMFRAYLSTKHASWIYECL